MAEEKDLIRAKQTFNTLCRALDKNGWHYRKNEAELSIECKARGDDLPIDISITVDAERMLVMLFSHIPFVVAEDKRLDLAVAVSVVNNRFVDGSFDYNIRSGDMVFRITTSFRESEIGEGTFMYMLLCACQTVDDYNDKFLMLSKGMLSLEQFISSNNQ